MGRGIRREAQGKKFREVSRRIPQGSRKKMAIREVASKEMAIREVASKEMAIKEVASKEMAIKEVASKERMVRGILDSHREVTSKGDRGRSVSSGQTETMRSLPWSWKTLIRRLRISRIRFTRRRVVTFW